MKKLVSIILISIMVGISLPSISFSQPSTPIGSIMDDGIWFDLPDAIQIDKDKQELEILRDEVSTLEGANTLLTKENELLLKEVELNKQLADIAEKKAEASDKAFQQMKEISDKWQELAKATKKPAFSLPQILGGILAGVIAVLLIVH